MKPYKVTYYARRLGSIGVPQKGAYLIRALTPTHASQLIHNKLIATHEHIRVDLVEELPTVFPNPKKED